MIGDRKPDLDAAKFNNCAFIGCNWGHADESEIQEAEIIVHQPKQILDALEKIKKNPKLFYYSHFNPPV